MKITLEQQYHGAALLQIAEDERCKSIRAYKYKEWIQKSSFVVNSKAAIFLKYASTASTSKKEYAFTFTREHINEIAAMRKRYKKTFIILVCVKIREICCLTFEEFDHLVRWKKIYDCYEREQYQLLVKLRARKEMRVKVTRPKGVQWDFSILLIPRNAFPSRLFE